MGEIVLLSFLSALYPTLVAATVVMLVLPKAEKLMFGFWLGAMITSVTCGLVIVFALQGSGAVKTTRDTVSPAVDLAIAALLVLSAIALAKGEDKRLRKRYDARHTSAHQNPPKWQQKLREGNPCTRSWWASCCRFPGSGISPPWIG